MALKKYHGWIVQKIFQVGRHAPSPSSAVALGDGEGLGVRPVR